MVLGREPLPAVMSSGREERRDALVCPPRSFRVVFRLPSEIIPLKKDFRIRKRSDFLRASRSGIYFRGNFVVMQCGFNGLDIQRVGFTASKKVGNAVVRNRCKRRMRAAVDLIFPQSGSAGVDYVLIAKKSVFNIDWNSLLDEIIRAVRFLNNRVTKCRDS
jgi:ribonuclease P protein component